MKYCKKLEMDVTMEERGKQLDDHQSYKDLEDANMWVGLNEKRRLEQLYVTQFEHCNTNFEAFYNISVAFSACDEALKRAKITRFTMRARFDAHEPEIALRSGMLRQLQVETRAAAAAVLSTFSLPRKHPSYAVKKKQDRGQSGDGSPIAVSEIPEEGVLAPVRYSGSRRLQRIPWNLVFVREPLERLRLRNRGAMAVLQRRVMTLRPQQRTLDKRIKNYIRCVVLVLLDEVTGNLILHIGQNEALVEESNQHTDLLLEKSDFSELTTHGLENEIILKPAVSCSISS